jgi:hypothetical protein
LANPLGLAGMEGPVEFAEAIPAVHLEVTDTYHL